MRQVNGTTDLLKKTSLSFISYQDFDHISSCIEISFNE